MKWVQIKISITLIVTYSFFFQVKSEGKRPNFLFGNVDFAHDDDEDDSDCEEYLVESEKAGSAGGESKTHAGMRNTVSGDSNFDIREGVRISDWCSQRRVLWILREKKPTRISKRDPMTAPLSLQAKQAESVGVTVKKMYKNLIPLKA